MPAANLSSEDVNATPFRLPNLVVRNRITDNSISVTGKYDVQQPESDDRRPTLSSYSSGQTIAPSLIRRQSEQSQQSDQGSLERLRQRPSSHGLLKSDRDGQANRPKKKGSGVLGFLTLKEPSTSAWQEYAETQKKAAAQRGGRATVVGLPGVSSQKLPEFVPPTNSKWDGLPDTAKRMSSHSKTSSKRLSMMSTSTRQTSCSGMSSFSEGSGELSSRRRYGSMSSKPSYSGSSSLPPSKRGSVQSGVSLDEPASAMKKVPRLGSIIVEAPSRGYSAVTPWDEPEDQDQDSDPQGVTAEPDIARQTFLRSPSPPQTVHEPMSQLPTPELELLEPQMHYQTSPEHSPRTPPANVDIEHVPSIADQLGGCDGQHEQLGTFWHSDTDNEAEVTKVTRSMSAGIPTNFSRPRLKQRKLHMVKQDLPLEPAIEEEDEKEDDAASQSCSQDERARAMSSKERLGLGAKMTMREQAAVLPWEMNDGPVVSMVADRPSTANSSAPENGKRKRLSLRLGRK